MNFALNFLTPIENLALSFKKYCETYCKVVIFSGHTICLPLHAISLIP